MIGWTWSECIEGILLFGKHFGSVQSADLVRLRDFCAPLL